MPTEIQGASDPSVKGLIGQVINNYQIMAPLGEGGMGAVFLAQHPFIGRKAAVKVLRPEFVTDASVVERFMNEARAANAIGHPNIIDIIDVGRLPSGMPYLMMEFLDGVSLTKRIAQNGRVSVEEAIDLAIQTTGALGAAHDKGIVHRDLKPDNIYVLPDTTTPLGLRVKILDFGIAKLRVDVSRQTTGTVTGTVMGSPYYMSPEQWGGRPEEIDLRTDIYALGMVLYEMLSGAPPFLGPEHLDIMRAHITQMPPSLRAKNPLVPEPLEAVIMKAVAKARADRYASMAEMQVALRAARVPAGIMPVAPTIAISPRNRGTPTAVEPLSMPPRVQVTTLRGATGEVRTSETGIVSDPRPASSKAWIPALAVLLLGAGGAGFALMPRSKSEPVPVPVPEPDHQSARPPIPPIPPKEIDQPPPAQPAQVHLQIDSAPTGATVIDEDTGARLGETPLPLDRKRSSDSLRITLQKDAYVPAKRTIPLNRDFEEKVELAKSPPHRSKSDPKKMEKW